MTPAEPRSALPDAPSMRVIDLLHLGRPRVICAWQVGDVLIDPGPSSCMATLLGALGKWRPRAILLTHIHLDHAGATGSLLRRWPDVEVRVHERGARHLIAPEKLVASATRLYGEDMQRLWGEVEPVPAEQVRELRGGESWPGWRVAYTPGHASHHVAYLEEVSRTAFCGDVAGVRIPPASFVVAPTPPPDIDLEAWGDSLTTVEAWRPRRLAITHFGGVEDVRAQLNGVRLRLAEWGEIARAGCAADFTKRLDAQLAQAGDSEIAALYRQAAPPEQLWQGLRRYWETRGSRAAEASRSSE